jgi:hypothetical protein
MSNSELSEAIVPGPVESESSADSRTGEAIDLSPAPAVPVIVPLPVPVAAPTEGREPAAPVNPAPVEVIVTTAPQAAPTMPEAQPPLPPTAPVPEVPRAVADSAPKNIPVLADRDISPPADISAAVAPNSPAPPASGPSPSPAVASADPAQFRQLLTDLNANQQQVVALVTALLDQTRTHRDALAQLTSQVAQLGAQNANAQTFQTAG